MVEHRVTQCLVTNAANRKSHGIVELILFLPLPHLASTAERSIPAAQMKLKRARLADDLNEKISLRPGPLELVEKNILPVDSSVKEAIKGSRTGMLSLCSRIGGSGGRGEPWP